jgi:glycosyltransferase 2 family protein
VGRLAVAALLLALAFHLALGGEAGALARLRASFVAPPAAAAGWLAAACALLGGSFLAGAARFRALLAGAGVARPFGGLLRAYLVAGFLNLVLPGAILGDAWRVWDVRRDTGRGSEALGIVALERLVSLAALALLALAAVPFLPLGPEQAWVRPTLAGVGGVCFAASGLALRPAGVALLRGILARLPWLPLRPRVVGERALGALESLASQPRGLAAAFGWSLAAQGMTVVAVYALSFPLGAPVRFPWYAAVVPAVALLATLPVSIGGAGVREVLYVALFGAVGMRSEAALALSLSVFAASLVWGGVGLALLVLQRRGGA